MRQRRLGAKIVSPGIRQDLRQVPHFLRRLDKVEPQDPLPPPLPDGRVMNVPGRGEMFVREVPAAPGSATVVLLHGWALSADLNWFAGGYEVAARHGRVVSTDIRGHGRGLRSEKPFTLEAAADDIAELIKTLDAAPAVVVGYSMGGSLALLCASRHPDVVAGLVLVSTGLQWRASLWERVMWASMAVVEVGLRFGAPRGVTERYLRSAVEQSPDLHPYQGWVKGEVRRGDATDIGGAGKELARFDARPLAADIDAPTVVVVTTQDRLIRRKRQELLARSIRGAKTVEIDGAHNAWLVRPKEFSAALDDALELVIGHATNVARPAVAVARTPSPSTNGS
jgi:pimeloyl-ACP methyl ester carboxylesterase